VARVIVELTQPNHSGPIWQLICAEEKKNTASHSLDCLCWGAAESGHQQVGRIHNKCASTFHFPSWDPGVPGSPNGHRQDLPTSLRPELSHF
jgi:hypothetical protein